MKKKRILLINPPFYKLMNSHFNGLSLGLSYIASILSKYEYDVKIYNTDYEKKNKYAKLRKIFNEYDNYKIILSNLSHPIWIEIKSEIKKISPDIVGITMLTGTYKSAQNIGKIIKEINKNIIVVVGGTHATVMSEEVIKNDCFDFVVRGEGEYTFLEIVNEKPLHTIKGLTYIDKNGMIINNQDRDFIKNLDSIPFPSRDLYINSDKYMDYGYIITGRGCPFECTFCASKKLWKKKVRFRSPKNVFDEIKFVHEKYNTKFFYFIDDTFTMNKNRTSEICKLLIKNNMDITWICDTRIDTLDEELLYIMKKSGCIRVKIGVESGSERILKMIKKRITKEQIRNTVSIIKKTGIEITIYLMIGFPTETNYESQETLDFAQELNPNYYSISILAPYPGTEIYDDIIKSNIPLPKEHWEYFFHQSKDMILSRNINMSLIDNCLKLNEKNRKVRI